ncbi:DNA-directed RNA polymerase core subunit rpc10 [Coniochaeta pulveracea]|uniref:DNA-directed RNA polymerase core subunit rpc10 n=1 Tax=Coniochaeta pulveracea TaxID=177199 RepID=A0A420YLP2_9PEZI|nr:DNA-directed RNA polymerase core subunit rpc10 [Coniochaeta pulveracea]
MSSEAYQPPTGGASYGSGATGNATAVEGPSMRYICSDCANKFSIKKNDPIRCTECGGRVLYKERTKRMVQFEAR